jgi:hypothetical protein
VTALALRAQCRDDWISGLVSELDDAEPYEYCKQLIDVHRLHLFDAVMQYRAIFFDATTTATSATTTAAAAAATQQQQQVGRLLRCATRFIGCC